MNGGPSGTRTARDTEGHTNSTNNLGFQRLLDKFFGDYQGIEAKAPFDARTAQLENPIVSTCVLVDMSMRDRGVRFSPDLAWIYCEDWEFWAKIVATGGRFGLVPEPLARHRAEPGSGPGLAGLLRRSLGDPGACFEA